MTNTERRREFVRRWIENDKSGNILDVVMKFTIEDHINNDNLKREREGFSSTDQKKTKEGIVFERFMATSQLPIQPYTHDNEDPPLPDIRCLIHGQTYFFELGE